MRRGKPRLYNTSITGFCPEEVLMSITVQIPTALRRLTAGTPRITCSATNLNELFSELDSQFPDLKPHLRDEAGEIRRFLNIYVNEEDIRFLGGASYSFQDGDEVLLVPSIAGGSR
jgi:molybdopterin converting factor small subunit